MTKKTRKRIRQEIRSQAVDDYTSGKREASEIAQELGMSVQNIYRWKTVREEKAKGVRVQELIDDGHSIKTAKLLAEQTLINDLLKKLSGNEIYQFESELTGLIKTTRGLEKKESGESDRSVHVELLLRPKNNSCREGRI